MFQLPNGNLYSSELTRTKHAIQRISTRHTVSGIQYGMANYVRIFMIVMLAAFAAGTVTHAASAVSMTMKMTLAAIDGADMGDCKDCPGGKGDVQPCDKACLSPILGVVPSGQPSLPDAETTTESLVLQNVAGRTGPPDPYPPRSIILS